MGFNRPTWVPGGERSAVKRATSKRLAKLRGQRERRARESMSARALEGSLISLAAVLGSEVRDPPASALRV